MRNRHIVSVLALLLILVLGVPAVAGGPNDNGNGNYIFRVESYENPDSSWPMLICEDGDVVGHYSIPGWYGSTQTWFRKPDGSRIGFTRLTLFESNDGRFSYRAREKQVVNSIDIGGTGLPNTYNDHTMRTWSDSDGAYAERSNWHHTRWDKDGDQTFDFYDTGWICLRDTVLP